MEILKQTNHTSPANDKFWFVVGAISLVTIIICVVMMLMPQKEKAVPAKKIAIPSIKKTIETPAISPPPVIEIINPAGKTLESRINPPQNFSRVNVDAASFGIFLRKLPLKEDGSPVLLFNGQEKRRQDVHTAVIDWDVGREDLQQCADAVMRLRAEYLFSNNRLGEIHFNFTSGFRAEYSKWTEGFRILVGNKSASWSKTAKASNTHADLRNFLTFVYRYAGTLSLSRELISRPLDKMEIGDVFIRGGSPGHAVIVVDMAENLKTGERLFLIAQSYMPAQEIHILKNFGNESISPWYPSDFSGDLQTPEWTFKQDELKRF